MSYRILTRRTASRFALAATLVWFSAPAMAQAQGPGGRGGPPPAAQALALCAPKKSSLHPQRGYPDGPEMGFSVSPLFHSELANDGKTAFIFPMLCWIP